MTYYLNDSTVRTSYEDYQEFEDAVRNALELWLDAFECPKYADTNHICCANHPDARFNLCPVCTAGEKAAEDDQAWLEGAVELPYEIKLPGLGNWLRGRQIRAWEA